MRRRIFREKALSVLLLTALCLTMMTGCGSSESGDTRTLEIGTSLTEDDFRSKYIREFAEEIEEKSEGRLTAKLHYSDEYADQPLMLSDLFAAKKGKLDLALIAAPYLTEETVPEIALSGLPYLFSDFDDVWEFMDSDLNREIEGKLPEHGVRVLSDYCGGFRCLSDSVRPIEEPGDLAGLVIGTVKSGILLDTFEALGAKPQPSVFTEIRDALEKGVYDGLDCGLQSFYRDQIYEVQPYFAVSNHAYNLWCFAIREDSYQALSDEEKEIVTAAAERTARAEREESKKVSEEIVADLENQGITVTYPDTAAFVAATEEIRLKYAADYAEIYERYRDEVLEK